MASPSSSSEIYRKSQPRSDLPLQTCFGMCRSKQHFITPGLNLSLAIMRHSWVLAHVQLPYDYDISVNTNSLGQHLPSSYIEFEFKLDYIKEAFS